LRFASLDPAARDSSLFFKLTHVDEILPFFRIPLSLEKQGTQFSEIIQHIYDTYIIGNRCVIGEVIPAMETCSSSVPEDSHQIWGNPCDAETHRFDSTICKFSKCEFGYYRYDLNTCLPNPVPTPKPPYEPKRSALGVVLIVVVVLVLVGGIIGLIVGCLLYRRRSRKQTPADAEEKSVPYSLVPNLKD
jgi:hypothetical protein